MIKMIVGGGMDVKKLVVILCFFCLMGCEKQFKLLQVDSVDKIEVLLASENEESRTEVIILTEVDEVRGMMKILRTGKLGRRVADRDMSLVQSSYYVLYKGDEVVQMISFNGNDSKRVWRGIECFEVSYSNMTPYEFIKTLEVIN